MSRRQREEKHIYRPPSPPRWKGRDSLDLAYQLNQRSFKLVSDMAARPGGGDWPLMPHDRALWSKLDAETIRRAAHFPFVILDVYFTNERWWHEAIESVDGSATPHNWPAQVAGELIQETLIFAWHTAKWDRCVARLSLGMLPAVAELIAALTPQQLAATSARHSGALRLRWQDDPDFWTQLLIAAESGNAHNLEDIHLHAQLLLSGELIAGTTPAKISP
jgi:hypothetical protein